MELHLRILLVLISHARALTMGAQIMPALRLEIKVAIILVVVRTASMS